MVALDWWNVILGKMEYARRSDGPPVDRTLRSLEMGDDDRTRGSEAALLERVKLARSQYGMRDADFNVAIVGAQGSGKSSLINGLRHVPDSDEDAAPVGVTSKEPRPYRASLLAELLVFWEFPGAGLGHPALTYYYDKKLYAFDLILIVSDRFQKVDFEVARAALRYKAQRFFFVRTKADVSLRRILQRPHRNEEGEVSTSEMTTTAVGVRTKQDVLEAMKTLRVEVDVSFQEGLRLSRIPSSSPMSLFIVSSPAFLEPHVYQSENSEIYEEEVEAECKLDEDALHTNLTNFVRNLIRRSKTTKYRPKKP